MRWQARHRSLLLACLVACLAVLIAAPAQADWQVRRDGSAALLERAETALRESPDSDDVARRLLRIAGPRGKASLVSRFRARAQGATSAPPVEAYARLLLAVGDGPAAAVAFTEVLRLSPRSLSGAIGRGRALELAGDAPGAIAAYDEALALEHRPQPRKRIIQLALAVLERRAADTSGPADLDRIISLRRELAELDPDRDAGAVRLADALERAGRFGDAAAALEARLPPGRAGEKLDLALRAVRLRLQSGDRVGGDRIAATLDELVRALPQKDVERRRQVWSVALAAARRHGTLGQLAQRLEGMDGRAGTAEWAALAEVRDEMGDIEGALEATRAAAARAPEDAELARRLVALLDRLGRDEEATAACEALARRTSAGPRFAIDLVDRHMRRGRREDAGAALDRAIATFGRDRAALLELAGVASRWGELERALGAWRRLRRLDPHSEVAVIGLGEAEFQRGNKDEARRTWAALRDQDHGSASGRLRLAEVLLEHDFVTEATAEARRAQALDPKSAAPHRLLAQIFERSRKFDDAVTEWNVVLGLANEKTRGPHDGPDEGTSLRREARVRLLGLFARQGRGRLQAEIRKLAEEARARPQDSEATLFLAEAQARAGDTTAAMTTLRGLIAGPAGPAGDGGGAEGTARTEAAFALVQLLKRTGQLDEAVERLDAVARSSPGRAREANLQIADIALSRYDTDRALVYASKAAAGADGASLARIAEIQVRAGAEEAAAATYRKAVARDAGSPAALALARLLGRQGESRAAAEVLDQLLATSGDDDTLAEAGRLSVDLGELLARLPDLEQRISDGISAGRDSAARRRTLVATLRRLLPVLYRDRNADELRGRLAHHALRALLEEITDTETVPDRAPIDLLGMLGNPDAAPALARIALRPRDAQPAPAAGKSRAGDPAVSAEAQLAAVLSLGRLGDARGRGALERLATTADPTLRMAAVWALGRIPDDRALPLLLTAVQDRRAEVAAAACLGLGRRSDERAFTALTRIATDGHQPSLVRRAAAVALGRMGGRRTAPALLRLLDSGDDDLARAAAFSLAWSRDARAVPELLERALLPRRHALSDASAPLAAIRFAAVAAPIPDESRLLVAARPDLELALQDLLVAPARADLSPTLRAHAGAIRRILADALQSGGERRREALAALDGRGDGPSLGAFGSEEHGHVSPETLAAIQEVVLPLTDSVANLADDADREVQAAVLRILAKLGDERVTAARIAGAVGAAPASPTLAAAASFAASRLARDRPEAVAPLVAALAPLLEDDHWRRRLAAAEALAAIGAPGLPALERARNDRNAIVRAAATEMLVRRAIDLPAPPSRMP